MSGSSEPEVPPTGARGQKSFTALPGARQTAQHPDATPALFTDPAAAARAEFLIERSRVLLRRARSNPASAQAAAKNNAFLKRKPKERVSDRAGRGETHVVHDRLGGNPPGQIVGMNHLDVKQIVFARRPLNERRAEGPVARPNGKLAELRIGSRPS